MPKTSYGKTMHPHWIHGDPNTYTCTKCSKKGKKRTHRLTSKIGQEHAHFMK